MGKNKKNKVGKKKIDIEKLLTAIIIIGLSIFLSISYYHKRKMLKDSKITTCIVVGFNEEPGTRWGYQVNVCYYVNEKKYFHRVSVKSIKCRIGDKFRIKYSLKDPNVYEVLWDERILEDSVSIPFEEGNRGKDE